MSYRSKALLVVALTIFVDSFIGGVVVPVLPLYADTLDLSSFQLGAIFAAYSAVFLFLSIPMGVLSDRFGRRNIMILGMVGLTITTVAFTFAKSFIMLVLIRLLQGIAASATWMVGPALIADMYPPKERGGKMGLAMAGNSFGFLFGPVAGGILYDWGGYAAPFLLSALITVLVLIATVIVIKEPEERAVAEEKVSGEGSLAVLLGNKVLLVGCGVMLLASMGLGFIDPLLPGYFNHKFGASSTTIGWLFAAMAIASLIAQPVFGRLSDAVGRVFPIATGIVAMALAFALFSEAGTIAMSMVAMAVLGLTHGLTTAPIPAMLADAMLQKNRNASYGTAIGFNNTAFSIGYTVGPLIGGAIVDIWSLKSLFIAFAVVMFCYLPVLLVGAKGLRRPSAIKA
ncbi:MAG: MFS transporter [Clostridia bacterium]|jgi:multidrug resistance protein|nr:MFS transporter [Clostridia bacterium]